MIIRPVRMLEDGTVVALDWTKPADRRWLQQAIGMHVFSRLLKPLADRDIVFARPGEPFEFSIIGFLSTYRRRLQSWKEGPLLVHDHHDTAGLPQGARFCLKSKKVVGILKARIYRDPAMHRLPIIRFPGATPTLHTTMLADSLPPWVATDDMPRVAVTPAITDEEIARKIRIVPGYSHSQMFAGGWTTGPRLTGSRPHDCYFAGTVCYGNWPVVMHRVSCINAMRTARGRGRACQWAGNARHWREYMRVGIRRAKVSPSPWGYGSSCFRDFESLMGGAILVKPDTTFCRGWPDLFHPDNNFYVKCRLDHADLPDIIADVSANWGELRYREMRERGWEFVKHYHDPDVTADHLAEVLHYFEGLA